ncbi:hypothetical protein GpartN1_g5546.t1 [Galdieria partita]|uniref:Uncharacterized protein n=1 Tax=Galdieria partita TaxID=83374 RepID=A0A9C7Q0D1_9RHOD|nr:hypothetical protein GpartN1_g5546.t1 [Galdieria partita]
MHSDRSYPPEKGTFPMLSSERNFRLSIFSPEDYKFAAYCRAKLQLQYLLEWKRACVKDMFGRISYFILGDQVFRIPLFQKNARTRCLHWSWTQQSKRILTGLDLSEIEYSAFFALEKSNKVARELVSFEIELIGGNL